MPREVAAVLDRPLPLAAEPPGELQQPAVTGLISPDGQLVELTARRGVDGHDRVRAHVRVDPDDDQRPFPSIVISRTTADSTTSGPCRSGSYQVTPSDPPTRRAT